MRKTLMAVIMAATLAIAFGCEIKGGGDDAGGSADNHAGPDAKPGGPDGTPPGSDKKPTGPELPPPGAGDGSSGQTGANDAASQGPCGKVEITDGVTAVRPPPGEKPSYGDFLVRRLDAEPATLNPLTSTDNYEQIISSQTMITLLDQDLDTGELLPLLANSWDVADDKVTFTFHLRDDVTFHDGEKLDADDVIYTLERIMDPKVDAASIRSYFVDMDSFKKLDQYTVQIKWKKPYFKALEMIGGVPILPKHILDDGTDFNTNPFGRKPVGAGRYKLAEWDTGSKIVLERYDGYFGEKPYFDKMIFKIITNDDVSLQLLKKGELDIVGLRRIQWVKQTSSKSFHEKFHKIHFPYPAYSYIGWNMRKPPFDDKRVRQAMTMLLNREEMVKEIFYCLANVAKSTYDSNGPFSDPSIKPWPYDPERAKALLAEAGWTDTDGDGLLDKDGKPFVFEMSFTAEVPEWEQMAVVFKEDLRKVGIDMGIRKLEWAVFLENVQQWKFDAAAMAWALDSNPDSYQLWHSSQADIKASSNHVGFKNEEVDRLIEMNRQEFDRGKRIEYAHRIDRILHEEQPYTFFLSSESLAAFDKRIHNVIPHPIRPIFHHHKWYVPEQEQKYRMTPGP